MKDSPVIRIGVVGTGFISSHFIMALDRQEGFTASRVLTRRPVDGCTGFPRPELLTNSLADLIENKKAPLLADVRDMVRDSWAGDPDGERPPLGGSPAGSPCDDGQAAP